MGRDPKNDSQFDQIEVPPIKVVKVAHVERAFACPHCQKTKKGSMPSEIKRQGLFGVDLAALIVFLKTIGCLSLRKIKNAILGELLGVKVSVGLINKSIKKSANILREAYEELESVVPKAPILSIDETGHRNGRKRLYAWTFASDNFVFFKIGTRSAFMLDTVLGENFKGTIVCDYYAAYLSYAKRHREAKLAHCWAHLIRDAKNCAENQLRSVRKFGENFQKLIKDVFDVTRARLLIADAASAEFLGHSERLRELESQIIKLCQNAPQIGKAKGLSKRFQKENNGSNYFTFIDDPAISLTNNLAERSLRFIAVDRKVCFGTRSVSGISSNQTMWALWRTHASQGNGESFYQYIRQSLKAHSKGDNVPSIIFSGRQVPGEFRRKADLAAKNELELERQAKKMERARLVA